MTSLLKWLATNAINWDIGRHSALRTQEPQGQAPSLPSRWFKRTEAPAPASPPVTDTITGLQPRVPLDVQVGPRISWLAQGLPALTWPPAPEPSPPKPVPFWVLQEKQLLKDLPEHLFVARKDRQFPTSFWWSLSVLLPYWKEIYSLNWGPPL